MDLRLCAAVAAAAACLGWWLGAGRVQARWDAAELQRERAVVTLAAQEARRQNHEAAVYAAQAARLRAAAAQSLPDFREALHAPISCPAGAELDLATLPVPAGVIERLQHVGADARPE
ncbi:UNVERIFIED_ORG: hypothetical protein LHJ69_12955 [Shinella sp. XGS7]|nr:hypothetical protein [Shinella sp. XGS7]